MKAGGAVLASRLRPDLFAPLRDGGSLGRGEVRYPWIVRVCGAADLAFADTDFQVEAEEARSRARVWSYSSDPPLLGLSCFPGTLEGPPSVVRDPRSFRQILKQVSYTLRRMRADWTLWSPGAPTDFEKKDPVTYLVLQEEPEPPPPTVPPEAFRKPPNARTSVPSAPRPPRPPAPARPAPPPVRPSPPSPPPRAASGPGSGGSSPSPAEVHKEIMAGFEELF